MLVVPRGITESLSAVVYAQRAIAYLHVDADLRLAEHADERRDRPLHLGEDVVCHRDLPSRARGLARLVDVFRRVATREELLA